MNMFRRLRYWLQYDVSWFFRIKVKQAFFIWCGEHMPDWLAYWAIIIRLARCTRAHPMLMPDQITALGLAGWVLMGNPIEEQPILELDEYDDYEYDDEDYGRDEYYEGEDDL